LIVFIVPKNSGLKKYKDRILENFSGKVIEVRGEDVPLVVYSLLKSGKRAVGITGEDLFKEFILENKNTGIGVIEVIRWEDKECVYGKPTLCLLGSKGQRFEDMPKEVKVCINKKYSKIAKKYLSRLEDRGFRFEKIYLSGATEEAFGEGVADLVIDIVYSGKSASDYGLSVYDRIFSSDIVIIGGKDDC
jgi:ATP phosphoribosyltransferase